MQLTISPDVEALVQKQLATGAYATAEDVVRHALQELDEETWTEADRQALEREIKRRLEDMDSGKAKMLSPEEFRQRLESLIERHLGPGMSLESISD